MPPHFTSRFQDLPTHQQAIQNRVKPCHGAVVAAAKAVASSQLPHQRDTDERRLQLSAKTHGYPRTAQRPTTTQFTYGG